MQTAIVQHWKDTACLLLLAAIAGPAPAWAGSCIETTRVVNNFTTSMGSALTTVKNQMASDTLVVRIFRTTTEKLDKSVKPSEQAQFKAGLGGTANDAEMSVVVTAQSGTLSEICSFVVGDAPGGTSSLEWRLPKKATEVCPNVKSVQIDCEKSWHKDKNQFHTVFTVRDL